MFQVQIVNTSATDLYCSRWSFQLCRYKLPVTYRGVLYKLLFNLCLPSLSPWVVCGNVGSFTSLWVLPGAPQTVLWESLGPFLLSHQPLLTSNHRPLAALPLSPQKPHLHLHKAWADLPIPPLPLENLTYFWCYQKQFKRSIYRQQKSLASPTSQEACSC